jgi:carboxypeptidase C (cathepsin A)
VAFWTNGGPGCSGLYGFLTEQGPFRVNKDMTLSMNPYAWNLVSNMVFIEAPCGVGFSYSENDDDYKTGDEQTALDNYHLIQGFLDRFPEFRQNDLYISSESYGGHYMPTLAKRIVDENKAGTAPTLNFKGFAVGNPFTNTYSGIPAMIDTYWGHQLISKPTYDAYYQECVKARIPNITLCEYLIVKINLEVGDLNPYALDYPVCTEGSKRSVGRMQRTWFYEHLLGKSEMSMKIRESIGMSVKGYEGYEPCSEDYATQYLNLPEVKAAIHVNPDITWGACSYTLRYDQKDGRTSMVPIYQELINGGNNLNILVYSGDDDAVCGTIGTQAWIWDMGYEVSGRRWQTYTYNEQTVGYITKWKNTKLAFVTVHNAGHEVPAYTPDVALDLWIKYLRGQWTNA